MASIAIAARGGDEENESRARARTWRRSSARSSAGATRTGEPEYRPAKDAFDTAELLDKPLADARSIAQRQGCEIVVSVEDGGGLPVPLEFDPKRIYVYTEKGIVTEIEGVGGGL